MTHKMDVIAVRVAKKPKSSGKYNRANIGYIINGKNCAILVPKIRIKEFFTRELSLYFFKKNIV